MAATAAVSSAVANPNPNQANDSASSSIASRVCPCPLLDDVNVDVSTTNDNDNDNMPVISLTPQRRTQSYIPVLAASSFQQSNLNSSKTVVSVGVSPTQTITIQLHRTTPIGKHYALQEQLCQALDHELSVLISLNKYKCNNDNDNNSHDAKKKKSKGYERAYAMGGQSVDLAVTVIPQHGYYYSMRHFQERQQSLASASRVLQQLETLLLPHLVDLDLEKGQEQNRRNLQVDQWNHQLNQLLLHQQHQQQVEAPPTSHDPARNDRIAGLVRPSSSHEKTSIRTTTTFYERLLDCGESMTTVMCPSSTTSWEDEDHHPSIRRRKRNHRPAIAHEKQQQQQQQTSFRNHSGPIPLHSRSQTAPAKLYPHQRQHQQPLSLDRALFLTGLDEYSSPQQQVQAPTTATATATAICMSKTISNSNGAVSQEAVLSASSTSSLASGSCMAQLCKRYETEFQSLRQKQRIRILPLDTHQGKCAGSVNGCALIAPLLCIQHLKKQHNNNDNHTPNVNGHEHQTVSSMSRQVDKEAPVTSLKSRIRTLSPTSKLYSSKDKDKDKTKRRSKKKGRRFPCSKQFKSSSCDDNDTLLLTCNNDNECLDDGVSNDAIVHVINVETPAILPKIRDKLGLVKDALIVPSDVHDYLLDHGNNKDENDDPKDENGRLNDGGVCTSQNNCVLAQEDFVTVCGGNVMDPQHLGQLIDVLSSFDNEHDRNNNNNNHNNVDPKEQQRRRKRKLAATFFFHEHVICIHRLWRGENVVWYDVIDSLPM
uniref:Uncharacterized protein n=1 Tax=Attheya septentrionalis TaxID=420275 RepID=A0A7S2UKL1_9STRA|mmetsp:Transcript_2900/g.5259  ORF Transcript_2900/g.5259 Transcript_2900/m.5259 type:complete len:765 (+) Transcript_2900:141-2435(+)